MSPFCSKVEVDLKASLLKDFYPFFGCDLTYLMRNLTLSLNLKMQVIFFHWAFSRLTTFTLMPFILYACCCLLSIYQVSVGVMEDKKQGTKLSPYLLQQVILTDHLQLCLTYTESFNPRRKLCDRQDEYPHFTCEGFVHLLQIEVRTRKGLWIKPLVKGDPRAEPGQSSSDSLLRCGCTHQQLMGFQLCRLLTVGYKVSWGSGVEGGAVLS